VAVAGAAPSYERYVASLPGGLDAYPEAQAKGALVRSVLLDHPIEVLRALPAPVRGWVTDPPLDNVWVSEARFCALIHAIAEARGWREQATLDWCRERDRDLLSGPLYRILMLAATPEAMLRHAPTRWAAFHRGSTLTFAGFADDGARASLAFPKGLFDPLLLKAFSGSFHVALDLAHARKPAVEIEASGDGFARFLARW
jgi:hypothetical protein